MKTISHWLRSLPGKSRQQFADREILTGIRFRCGLAVSPAGRRCICGQAVDTSGHHFFVCSKVREGFNRRHDSLRDMTRTLCHSAGIGTLKEVPVPGGRLDIEFLNLSAEITFGDISVTHPPAKSYLDGAAMTPGYAASEREKRKMGKYRTKITRGSRIIPLVMETYGTFGKKFLLFLQEVYKVFMKSNLRDHINGFKKKSIMALSCTLQKGNIWLIHQGCQSELNSA